MALSPVTNTVAALEADPPGSKEGGKTSIPVSIGDGNDDDGAWSSRSGSRSWSPPLPSSTTELSRGENEMGKSIIAIHLAIFNARSPPSVPAATHVRSHLGGRYPVIPGEAITNLQNNGSGTSSTSTLLHVLSSQSGAGGGHPEMDKMCLPRM